MRSSWKWWWGVGVTLVASLWVASANAGHLETDWPSIIISNTCVDLFDTVSPEDISLHHETSGSPNNRCDRDNRIIGPGPVTTTTTLGPFVRGDFGNSMRTIRMVSFALVTPAGGTWNIDVLYRSPIDTTQFISLCQPLGAGTTGCTGTIAGTAAPVILFGHGAETVTGITDVLPQGFPDPFWIRVNLGTATSINMFLILSDGH